MKKIFYFVFGIFLSVNALAFAEDEPQQKIFKESFSKPFPLVYKTIKKVFEDQLCRVERDKYQEGDGGLFKGNITTEFCVFSTGADSTEEVLEKYSAKLPYIRGARWVAGRIQYKIKLTESEDGNTNVELRGELSGFEEYVTNRAHFWVSNGLLEEQMMATLKKAIDEAKAQ